MSAGAPFLQAWLYGIDDDDDEAEITEVPSMDRPFMRPVGDAVKSVYISRENHYGNIMPWHLENASDTPTFPYAHAYIPGSLDITAFIQQMQTVPLAHGYVAANGDGVGVVDNPVHDRIRRSALLACVSTDKPIPIIRFMLRAEDGRAHFRPRFNDVQEIKGLIHSQATLQPFIQDEKINGRIHLRDLLQHCAGISLNRGTGNHEFIRKLRAEKSTFTAF